mmetsp:Transcript_59727/g.142109  ORF Transcript_59727/g.142109 Transcript_59727/m.142109 type:complete len:756 (-) Transcript_59727:191-2458(-)
MPQPIRAMRSRSTGFLTASSPASSDQSSGGKVGTPVRGGDASSSTLLGRPSGPKPLLRFAGDGQLQLQPEGLALLRRATPPVHVVFAIGGSRCGKSTTGNALVFDDHRESDGFKTGATFEPVTTGVDVAVRSLRDGGTLVVGDCEGAFHICGSEQSARGFGTLGLLAYSISSNLLHVSMGSIDERDIEALGYLAAYAESQGTYPTQQGLSPGLGSEANPSTPPAKAKSRSMLSPRRWATPALVLLVNGARFDLGDAVAQRLLKPPHGDGDVNSGRWCARAAISRGFHGNPALEALPACDHAAYRSCVEGLRQRILEHSPVLLPGGMQASGCDVADRLIRLVAALNNEAGESCVREPQPATEELYKSMHLEPLVEEIAKKFATVGAEVNLVDHQEDALGEFDRRTAWLTTSGSKADENTPAFDGLVAESRARLATRLAGISEALERGRQHGVSRRWATPSSKAGKENVAPSTPGTPRKRNMKQLDALVAEECARVETACQSAKKMVEELQAEIAEAGQRFTQYLKSITETELQQEAQIIAIEDSVASILAEASEDRRKAANKVISISGETLVEIQKELEGALDDLPDPVGACASQLNELRTELEGERFRRHEAGNAAASALDADLHSLKEELEEESSRLLMFRETAMKRFGDLVTGMERHLQDERCQRQERHSALMQVVERFRASVQATADSEAARDGESSQQEESATTAELAWSSSQLGGRRRPSAGSLERSMETRLRTALLRQVESPRARRIFS